MWLGGLMSSCYNTWWWEIREYGRAGCIRLWVETPFAILVDELMWCLLCMDVVVVWCASSFVWSWMIGGNFLWWWFAAVFSFNQASGFFVLFPSIPILRPSTIPSSQYFTLPLYFNIMCGCQLLNLEPRSTAASCCFSIHRACLRIRLRSYRRDRSKLASLPPFFSSFPFHSLAAMGLILHIGYILSRSHLIFTLHSTPRPSSQPSVTPIS